MEISFNIRRNWATNFSKLTKACIDFTILAILVMFFEADLQRILTPLIEPFLLLLLFLFYLILVIVSLVYIPLQLKKEAWHAFLPLLSNLLTFLSIYYLFIPLSEFRINFDFLIKQRQLDNVVQWVNESIQNGSLSFQEGKEQTVILPEKYRNLTDRNRIYVTKEHEDIRIFFSRGGGMFEYYPGYMYHSANVSPPIENGDIVCMRKLKPNWYDCY
jgi:hypothetical protein